MSGILLRNTLCAIFASTALLISSLACAGGITLGGTRVVYPTNSKQVSISVRNTSEKSNFLVQSWIEQADGKKTSDFFVTPPLYASGPGQENTLRLMYIGQTPRTDRETLYYFNTKAIPAVDKEKFTGKNFLMLTAITRIKLFFRPEGLMPSVDKAPGELTFKRGDNSLIINNPTPYYITLARLKLGDQELEDTMVAPKGSITLPLKTTAAHTITFRTINDYGSVTPVQHAELK